MALIRIHLGYLDFNEQSLNQNLEGIVNDDKFIAVSYYADILGLIAIYKSKETDTRLKEALNNNCIGITTRATKIKLSNGGEAFTLINLLYIFDGLKEKTYDQEGDIAVLYCPTGNVLSSQPPQTPHIYESLTELEAELDLLGIKKKSGTG